MNDKLTAVPEESPIVPKPIGAWSLRGIKDTREDVIEAVQSAAFVPTSFKTALIETIEDHHPKAKLLRLDAHCQVFLGPDSAKHCIGSWDISTI